MKKQLVLEECEWKLTDEAKQDKRLNPIDLDILMMLQFIKDGKDSFNDGYFNIILKNGKNIRTSLEGKLNEFGIKCDYTTVSRSINKLWCFGYIDYKKGYYNNKTQKGCWPKIKILKGTIDIKQDNVNNCERDDYDFTYEDVDLTYSGTVDYSDIAIAQENEKENKKEKEIIKRKVEIDSTIKLKLFEYFKSRSVCGSFECFQYHNPTVEDLGIPIDIVEMAYYEYMDAN